MALEINIAHQSLPTAGSLHFNSGEPILETLYASKDKGFDFITKEKVSNHVQESNGRKTKERRPRPRSRASAISGAVHGININNSQSSNHTVTYYNFLYELKEIIEE